jgi:hypothetical protein
LQLPMWVGLHAHLLFGHIAALRARATAAETELAEMKARRCTGCRYLHHDEQGKPNCGDDMPFYMGPPAAFCCSDWSAAHEREEAGDA